MKDLYYKTAAKIGYKKPPSVFLKEPPNKLAGNYVWGCIDQNGNYRLPSRHIELNEVVISKLISASNFSIDKEMIIMHELTHWRWREVSANADTKQTLISHGASFLAGWLAMLRRHDYSTEAVEAAANWHSLHYGLTPKDVNLALSVSEENNDTDKAIIQTESEKPRHPLENLMIIICLVFVLVVFNFMAKFTLR